MNLTDYLLSQPGGTAKLKCPVIADLAGKAGCSAGTLYMIAGGHKVPSAKLAARISDATGGEVPRDVLLPEVFGSAPVDQVA